MALQLYKIATVEVGSAGASSIDFTSIPQGYTDLKVVVNARTDYAAVNDFLKLNINGNGASLSQRFLYGTGSVANSTSYGSPANVIVGTLCGANATNSTFGNAELYIPNYTSANNKSISADVVTETNSTATESWLFAGLWSNTSAITTLAFFPYYGTVFAANSTATLYGIL